MDRLPDGFYEKLIEDSLAQTLSDEFGSNWRNEVLSRNIESKEAAGVRHEALITAIRHELAAALDGIAGDDRIEAELALCLNLLRQIRGDSSPGFERPLGLLTTLDRTRLYKTELPRTGLTHPSLFTSGRHEPSLLGEILREIGNVDHVDILVSFMRSKTEYHGFTRG